MDKEDSIEERQNSEMDVLKSMFGDDLHDLRGKAVWNQWMPLNLTINLVPQQGSSGLQEDHVKVDLHVICPKNYPNTAPQIILENAKGLSKQVLDELKGKLKLKAKELLGEVMIYEFVQMTQAFLYQHNKPPTASFYDQMLKRQKELEEAKERAKREEMDRENQEIEKKIKQRKKILKSEFRLKRERLSIESSDDSPTLTMRNSFSSGGKLSGTYDQEDVVCNHGGPTIVEFSNDKVREVKKMRCTYHSKEGNVIRYQALDTTSGELFVLLEWNIKVKEDEDYHQIQKQIANIEQELIYLVKLKFNKLVHYINMTQEFCSGENSITVHILQEDVAGFVPLTTFSNSILQFNEEGIGRLAKEILTALEFLHRNNVIHRDVCASNVHLNSYGLFQVTNYSVHRRLMDLCTQCNASTKYNKKTDIYKFGILILSLIKGRTFSEDNIAIPAVCSPSLKDFLARCLNKDEKERPTATQLLNHPFVEGPQDGAESFFPNVIVDNAKDVQDSYPELPITNLKTLTHNDQPRIHRDFEVIRSLGKGAYGHVLEVRNRIDANHYAIKQIALNPRNKQLNRKMTREVTLLSKLNHENVVRYYNAWIETGILENDETDSSATPSPFVPKSVEKPKAPNKNDLELLAPHLADWSVSYESKSKVEVINEESSDDDDEEWGVVMQVAESNSDSIQFIKDGSSSSDSESSQNSSQNDERKTPKTPITREVQFMYIQMEFCEKSTLRTVIDSELYLNIARIQQLFREIVEGLAHIHQQGMIHRDLKPVNIFLDSKGHIKIGDFGLATSNITLKHGDATNINKEVQGNENQSSHSLVDGSLTGQIGTALYTAPELNSATKTIYTQKVDIYSLGIIYFEMCHKPLDTQMERIKVLSGLRSREIIFPSDFKNSELNNQETLIMWLLNHDASKRPTSQELLQSDLVPQPILEEKKLKETFVKTLGNPQSKYYKYLIASCFEQTMTPTLDIDYNLALSTCVPKSLQLFRYIKEVVENVCKLHGGQTLCTPLLLPNSKYYEGVQSSVKLMAHSGIIVSIPYDLRVSFARYVAWNKITTLRRYTIDRVYRERKVFDSHPKELHECAFDIVTPNSKNFIADAEVLYIVHEIINGFPGLSNKNFRIRLNHTNLIRAILLYCGIKDAHNDIFKILSDAKEGEVTKFQVRAHLIKLGLSDSTIKLFLSFVDLEIPLEKIRTSLQMITKKTSNDAGLLAKQSLQDLKSIVEIVKALGVTFNIVIVPGMVYNIAQFSGMMCQVVCELKKKKRHSGMDVLAAGGRYDDMITHYRSMRWPSTNISKDVTQSAVGVSVSFDVLGQALQDESNENYDTECVEVVVCSIGSRVQIKEIAQILKDLRSAGIRCSSIEASSAEDMQEQCTFLNVCHAIMLQHNKPGGGVVRTWDRNKKFQDTSISLTNVVKDFQSAIESWKEKTTDQVVTTKPDSTAKAFMVSFILNTNLSASAKEKYEEQIKSKLQNIMKHLTKPIFVVAVNLEATVIIDIGNYLNLKSERNYRDSTKTIVEMHESHKKYLLNVCHEIYYRQTLKSNPIVALYSIMDSFVVFI